MVCWRRLLSLESTCWHFLHFAVDCNSVAVSIVAFLVAFAAAVIVLLSTAISSNISSMRLAVELVVELAFDVDTSFGGRIGVGGCADGGAVAVVVAIPSAFVGNSPNGIVASLRIRTVSSTAVAATAAAALLLFSFLRLLAACPFI